MSALSWIKEHKGKKSFMVDDYIQNKVLDETEEIIGIEKFDYIKISIDTDDKKLLDGITLKNVVIWITCDIKDYD